MSSRIQVELVSVSMKISILIKDEYE